MPDKHMVINLENPDRLVTVAKALGSDLRVKILTMLDECSMNVAELAAALEVPISTVSINLTMLEEAGLVRTERLNARRGVMKLCSRKVDSIRIGLSSMQHREASTHFETMPIGMYSDCEVRPVCGLLSDQGAIGTLDDPDVFYDTNRMGAQLLWFQRGFVEYRFARHDLPGKRLKCLETSFECCSEAPNYRMDYPSDISVWLCDRLLGTWTCPGDYGGRRGRNTPEWWPVNSTQFGLLKRWRVDDTGTYLDDVLIDKLTLKELEIEKRAYISLRIGIEENAAHQGGINLFGEQFGDHHQPIILRYEYETEEKEKNEQNGTCKKRASEA